MNFKEKFKKTISGNNSNYVHHLFDKNHSYIDFIRNNVPIKICTFTCSFVPSVSFLITNFLYFISKILFVFEPTKMNRSKYYNFSKLNLVFRLQVRLI